MKHRYSPVQTLTWILVWGMLLVLPSFAGEQGSATADRPEAEEYYYLPVFETSDVHGYLADTAGDEPQHRLAYISDKVKDVRGYGEESSPELALLLDGGDFFQGNTMSNLLKGMPISAAYKIMGYDAVTIGNHEFDWGIENTIDPDATMMDYSFSVGKGSNTVPVVVSNMYLDGKKVTFAEDYIILEKTARNGSGQTLPVRIAVIGFAGEYSDSIMYGRFAGRGFTISLDYWEANALAESLESSGMCDATILLAHEDPSVIAEGIGADTVIDLVMGGHSHNNVNGTTDWGLRYLEPAGKGSAYAYCELAFELCDGIPMFRGVSDAKIVQVTERTDSLTDKPENADDLDPALVSLTGEVIEALSSVFETEIGYITTPVGRYTYIPESGERSTVGGNWVTSIMARSVGADVAFENNGGIRTDLKIPAGQEKRTVTLSDIYTLLPFGNRIYCYELTYEELLTVLEYALTDTGKTVLSQMSGIDCYYTDETVNAIVTADKQTVYANGVWANGWKDKKLLVAINEYMATNNRISSGGMENPFCAWNDTDRLISTDGIDNEGAYLVLSEEAAASGGALFVDTKPHYINRAYDGKVDAGSDFVNVPAGSYYYDAVVWLSQNDATSAIGSDSFDPDALCSRAQMVTLLWLTQGMPAAGQPDKPFTDLDETAYYYHAILWAYENGITFGTGGGLFDPDDPVTRCQTVTFLYRTLGGEPGTEIPFADVTPEMYCYDAVLWAYKNGITQGTDPAVFSPDDDCLFAQIVSFLYRAYLGVRA